MMYKLFSVVLIFTCAGCASIATWHYSDATLASFLQNRRTHCESLPRIYSGVYFDYCWLDSDPQRVYGSAPIALLLIPSPSHAAANSHWLIELPSLD